MYKRQVEEGASSAGLSSHKEGLPLVEDVPIDPSSIEGKRTSFADSLADRLVEGGHRSLHGKYVFTVFVTETKTTVFHCFSKQVDSYLVEYGRGGCVGRVGAAGTVRVWIGDRQEASPLTAQPSFSVTCSDLGHGFGYSYPEIRY